MNELSDLIYKALALNITDNRNVWGVCKEGNRVEANVIGMILIGKVGLDKAIEMFLAAFKEISKMNGPAPNSDAIAELIGLSLDQCEELILLQWPAGGDMDINTIANGLASGKISFSPTVC